MKFSSFKIRNYKGIEDITFNLNKSPDSNIYVLVGLNESGKTTILEAINFFSRPDTSINPLETSIFRSLDYNSLIPINKIDNFNEKIEIDVTLKLEADDISKINKLLDSKTKFQRIEPTNQLSLSRIYYFANSKFTEAKYTWSGFKGVLKSKSKKSVLIDTKNYNEESIILAEFCRDLIPTILYFPNFLYDFPSMIYLETKTKASSKQQFFIDLIQDILNSLGNNSDIQNHLINRIKSEENSDKRALDSLLQKMSKKVTDIVFDAWNKIFNRNIRDTRIELKAGIDDNMPYVEFQITAEDGIYEINERSLGFRWFFTFLLFTQFRPYRNDSSRNVLFLFDEPASYLHSKAQSQLLSSFEKLTTNGKVIYTTHSHHLINPRWLEATYVVKNEGLNLDNSDDYNIKKTKITIEAYRDFVTKHPKNTAYFQPILDVLEYTPSDLEMIPNCVFFEGKNDFYTTLYFNSVIIKNSVKINMAPSTGSGNLDTLISLYTGWSKKFIILLDSDLV